MTGTDDESPMAKIKAREAAARAAIERGDASVEIGQFRLEQLGLSFAVADSSGRLWRMDGDRLVLIGSKRRNRRI
jgi:hypothetical protein